MVHRWLYRGGRPNRLARWWNHADSALYAMGLIPHAVSLEVIGRRSGKPVALPLVLADYQGERYLVSMLGRNAGWVRNVEAAGGRAVLRHGRREAIKLIEVEPAERPPIVRRYLALAPGARPHIPVDRRAPVEAFESIAADIPVFRVVPDTAPDVAPERDSTTKS